MAIYYIEHFDISIHIWAATSNTIEPQVKMACYVVYMTLRLRWYRQSQLWRRAWHRTSQLQYRPVTFETRRARYNGGGGLRTVLWTLATFSDLLQLESQPPELQTGSPPSFLRPPASRMQRCTRPRHEAPAQPATRASGRGLIGGPVIKY